MYWNLKLGLRSSAFEWCSLNLVPDLKRTEGSDTKEKLARKSYYLKNQETVQESGRDEGV